MRLLQRLSELSVLASLVLAHEGKHHEHHHQHSHDHVHEGHDHGHDHENLGKIEISGSTGSLMPGSETLHNNVPAADQKILWKDEGAQKDTKGQDEVPRQHPWTHSTPCYTTQNSNLTICAYTDANFAAGRGASFIMPARRAAYLATAPAFVEPDLVKNTNQDLHRTIPAKYEKKLIPGKGMGLIATQHIYRGDLIMANTVSLMIDYRAFEELKQEEYQELQVHAVDNLPELHRKRIMELSTHDEDEFTHTQRVDKIAATNAFDIDADADDEEQDHGFYVVFPEIARMNHDCRPNADYYFDHGELTQFIHATRDIIPGEELTLSYINPVMKRSARIKKLQRIWGFECACPLCTQEKARVEASDARLRQIRELNGDFGDWTPESRASPPMAELIIGLYQQEKLWGSLYEAYVFAALEYNAAGEPWTAVKYARLAIDWGIPVVGPKDADVKEMQSLAEDPWAHWSWLKRMKIKGGWGKKREGEEEAEE
ncbi:hypothetical protein QBC35DRAFT_261721 [Podospora australis]|uniref:SET domain-containing protein n=1 Tax=Podospora australis TaxID=1536484 RepID=A0AAN6X371_9PEZI|nr:hypothetical protein QBC35DRAFT_261721 [Podospora australis]